MNRHDRRKAAAQARHGSDTMGSSYSTAPLPDYVLNHPAFKAGEKAAATGELPEGYVRLIHETANLMREWVSSRAVKPDLRWVQEREGGAFIAAGLDVGAHYLADSPDAFALPAWLDERTGQQLSLNQARWALRIYQHGELS